MDAQSLHTTKKNLSIMFAIIVFTIALVLEVTFFTARYVNISYNESKQFDEITSQIHSQIELNPDFLALFIAEGIKFKPPKDDGFRRGDGPDRGLKFLSFLILDTDGNIIAQNYNQDIDINEDFIDSLQENNVQENKGVAFKKINIESVGGNFKYLIFFKREGYSIDDYFEDIFFFLVVNVIFSIFFYFIGLYFVGKNLKPVEQSLSDMNDFIHNANHELKTPIAVISSNMQLLKSIKIYEDELVVDSLKEIKRMNELLDGLSELSNINGVKESHEILLSEIIQDIHQELKNDIAGKNLNIDINIIKDVSLNANRQYLYIVFSNLFRNAIKYNHNSGNISILIDKNSFTISNSGEAIEKDDIPFIFDRFFKGEKSRQTEGFGIGLSLVKKICDIYGWKISVNSEGITEFKIIFS